MQKLLTVKALAHRLGLSETRIYDLARQGLIPSVRLGRQIRFDPVALEEFVRSGGKGLEGGWRRTA